MALRTEQRAALLRQQQEQIDLLARLLSQTGIAGRDNA